MSHLVILPILLPLLTGLLLLLIPARYRRQIHFLSVTSSVLLAALTIFLLIDAGTGAITVYALGNWMTPFGIVLVADRLSALLLVLTSTLAFFSLLYTTSKAAPLGGQTFHSLIHFLLMGVNGAFLTGDIFNLFVFFEVLLLASYALLLQGGGLKRAKAGLHYVVLNLIGSAIFLIAVAILYGLLGTLNMADMAVRVSQLGAADAPLVAAAAILLLLVFGLKAAVVPVYFWLPRAYASASAPVAALFAIMTKVGVYAIIRVYSLIFGSEASELADLAQPWLWPLGLATLSLGVIGVLAAQELRMQIAYLLIISVGTLLAGVALNSVEALGATLFYLLHSTWICAALFLLVDLIARQRGEAADQIVSGPVLSQSVLLGAIFFIASISVIGMPPFSGFIGKALLLQAASGYQAAWLWGLVLVGTLGVMTALSRSGSTVFWRTNTSPIQTTKADPCSLLAIIGLTSFSLGLMLGGDSVIHYTRAIAEQVLQPQIYIDAVLDHRPVGQRSPL